MVKILIDRSVVEQALLALNPTASGNWTPTIALNAESAIHALRAALEQPQVEQEPVAWMFQHEETGRIMYVDAQQVEWGFEQNNPRLIKIRPAYLHPQPPRQPLTDAQITDLWIKHARSGAYIHAFAQAIERFHGIGGEA